MDKSNTSSPIFTTNPAFKSESFVKDIVEPSPCFSCNLLRIISFVASETLLGVATVNHIAKTELIRDPDSFADVVRGLHVFGRKILRSEAVQRGVISIG